MASELEHSSATFDEEGFSRRIDDLVEDALRQQSAEQRALTDALEGARTELRTLRELVERRDTSVADALEARLSGIATHAGLEQLTAEIRQLARAPEMTDLLAPMVGQLEAVTTRFDSLEVALASVGEAIERVDPWKPAVEVQRTFRETLALAIRSIEERASEAEKGFSERVERALAALDTKLDSTRVEEEIRSAASELREAIQGAGARTFDRLVQLQSDTEEMGSAIESAAARLDQTADDLKGSLDATTERMAGALDATTERMVGALDETGTRLDRGLNETSDILQGSLTETSNRLESSLNATTERLIDSLAESARQLTGSFDETTDRLAESLGLTTDQLRGALDEALSRQTADDQERSAAISRQMGAVRKAIEDQSHEVTAAVETSIDPFAEQLRRFASLLTQANRRITESNARIEALQESLITYLARRDDQLEEARSRAIAEVVGGVAENLKRRERVRIGDALKKSEQQRKDRRDAERYRKMKSSVNVASESSPEKVASELATASPTQGEKVVKSKPKPTAKSQRSKARGRDL